MTSGTSVALQGVWGASPDDVYAVGKYYASEKLSFFGKAGFASSRTESEIGDDDETETNHSSTDLALGLGGQFDTGHLSNAPIMRPGGVDDQGGFDRAARGFYGAHAARFDHDIGDLGKREYVGCL